MTEEELLKLREKVRSLELSIGAAALKAGGYLRVSRGARDSLDQEGELVAWSEPDAIVYAFRPKREEPDQAFWEEMGRDWEQVQMDDAIMRHPAGKGDRPDG